ncbi:MAG: hypothetical protein WBM17_02450 [Anaerolineales bacterium]
MPAKRLIGDIARYYTTLKEAFPEMEIDPRIWGPKGLEILSEMAKTGPIFRQTASYLIEHNTKLYLTREAKGIGAGWHETFSGERWISVDQSFGFIDSLLAIGHETRHLRQDIRVRCSVEGEYSAWRLYYILRAEFSSSGIHIPLSEDEQRLAAMPDNPTRQDLIAAQALIQKMAGPYYLIGKAPLKGEDWPTAFLAFGLKILNRIMYRGELI